MKIAICNQNSGDDLAANLAWIDETAAAVAGEADVLLLPENTLLMPRDEVQRADIAEPFAHGELQQRLGNLARSHGLWIVVGSMLIRFDHDEKPAQTQLIFDPSGQCVAYYQKMHLFDVALANGERYLESGYTRAGRHMAICHTPFSTLGMSICYDLRYAEQYRKMAEAGAEVLLVPSAFTQTTGEAHWHTLLRARAIETQSFVVASAQTGFHGNGRQTFGHALAFDPWGECLADLGTEVGVQIVSLEMTVLHEIRQQMAVLQQHKELGDVCYFNR
ncbi:MAG: carbon-nitrogen hydrolase family protein [Gammaproteobacteria bacterium]|nr:carbon-nitrogen hydrolase family protein [Gammaproteobacteria bacterium]